MAGRGDRHGEGLSLPVALAGPAVFRGQHQHQSGAIAQHQQVSRRQEDAQVGTPAIHVGEYRAQAGGQVQPAAPAEHAGIGAQRVAEEARGTGGVEPLAVGGLRFPFTLGEVVLLVAIAVAS